MGWDEGWSKNLLSPTGRKKGVCLLHAIEVKRVPTKPQREGTMPNDDQKAWKLQLEGKNRSAKKRTPPGATGGQKKNHDCALDGTPSALDPGRKKKKKKVCAPEKKKGPTLGGGKKRG